LIGYAGIPRQDNCSGWGISLKTREAKPNSETKRSSSLNFILTITIGQRSFDRVTSSSMYPIMEKISKFLICNLKFIVAYPHPGLANQRVGG
jgi:hypothetical protein